MILCKEYDGVERRVDVSLFWETEAYARGEQVQCVCPISANPLPHRRTWRRLGVEIGASMWPVRRFT